MLTTYLLRFCSTEWTAYLFAWIVTSQDDRVDPVVLSGVIVVAVLLHIGALTAAWRVHHPVSTAPADGVRRAHLSRRRRVDRVPSGPQPALLGWFRSPGQDLLHPAHHQEG